MGGRVLAAVIALLSWVPAAAVDLNLTGFGTIGYARSNENFSYLRYIDDGGTFKVDSIVGVQAEAQFNSQWGFTIQGVASAPRTRDNGYEAKIRWAFVSFRPQNDWLLRAGRVRPPVLINTQNAEVGVTYDQARLPVEVYSLSPVYDVDGGAVTKTWSLENAEINLDAFWGKSEVKFRMPFQREAPQTYIPEKVTFKGLVLSHSSGPLFLRAGVHHAVLRPGGEQPFVESFTPNLVPVPPPFGGTLYMPSNFIDKIDVTVLTLGADWRSGDWRITSEYGQRIINDSKLGADSKSGYVTVARSIGKWTPYMTYARLLSGSDTRKLYQDVNTTPVPLGVQLPPPFGPGLPASFHRSLADQVLVYDQYSTMLGASYSFSATSKVKLEWMRTKVGMRSALVDGDVHDKGFNVFSVSYSVAF